ncbi:MAG: DNA/RNA non-specific endonuclease [Lentisphaerae bacterium]|jgi:endonuclease G|nr:DNA/RNA non-specific endonuclease [Lentisphaerota bacterium]
MARKPRRKNKIPSIRKLKKYGIIAINVVILLVGITWYAFQPQARKQEVNRLVSIYAENRKNISLIELASDIWTLYYGKNLVPCDVMPGEQPLFGGIPTTEQNLAVRTLQNDAYWVGYSEERRAPVWCAYRLFSPPKNAKASERPGQFMVDDRTIAKVTSDHYTGSGFDRGHMAPNNAIAICYGEKAQQQTFLMSNIVPQRHDLNAGLWKTLESKELYAYAPRCKEIWIITGPIYPKKIVRTMPSGIPIPDAFYKIIVDQVDNQLRALAFIFEHNADKNKPLDHFLASIDEIEERTGFDFFNELPAEVQDSLEAQKLGSIW